MRSVTPAAPDTEAAQAWVAAFAEGWLAPTSADAFADHFQPWLDPRVRLIQPQLPTMVGHRAFRERFARPLFALIPDLHGQVQRFAVGADCAYIELTMRGTLGGRPVAWRVCDRASLRAGVVVERESYFDPLPLLRAVLTRPRAWPALAHSQMRQRPNRATSRDEGDATAVERRPGHQPTEFREEDHMRKVGAAAGSVAHFVLQPGVVAGLVPWWLTGWRVRQPLPSWAWTPLRVAGVALLAAGAVVLAQAFARFVMEGVGTPAPVAPTQRLVVGGPYRYVRNPMYLAVTAFIVGQALALGQPALLLYAAAVGAAMAAFAHGYEEPTLRRQFGAQYEAYRRAVPAWWPRRHPWQPGQPTGPPAAGP
jgi:protein-S-isoprenylcysteine O-methyltransferase Ste14/ketosteroid isomerase-like protein